MGEDWEKLAGESGEKVPTGRFSRMWKLGSVGAGVAASSLAGKVKNMLGGNDEDLDEVYRKQSIKLAEALGQLKGASMKIGQMLSADPELLPPEFAQGLTSLQRDAPPMTYMTVKAQIERALDRPIEMIFSRFDPEPVGSASIGQVHRARLDTGEEVAVKIQYPGVAESLESDLRTLKSMLLYGRAMIEKERLDNYFAEIQQTLLAEADYIQEAESMERFGALLREREGIRAPRPFMQWCSKEVLVMEFVEGQKLDEALVNRSQEDRERLLKRWVELYVWMFHEKYELHADPHPGNFILDKDDNLVVLDFGCIKSFDPAFADGILKILDTIWTNTPERAFQIYDDMGFGRQNLKFEDLDPKLLAEYHEIVMAPFLRDEPFDFTSWAPATEGKMWMLKHPTFLGLMPPAQSLMYFRMLSAIKGLLSKFEAKLNIYELAYETVKRRGLLSD